MRWIRAGKGKGESLPRSADGESERVQLERIKVEHEDRRAATEEHRLQYQFENRKEEIQTELRRFERQAESAERQAQMRIFYGLVAVISGLIVLGVLYGLTLYFFTSGETDFQQAANNIVASMGVVTGVIGSLVSAYFGIQLGSAGRERAEAQRDRAVAASVQSPNTSSDET